MQAEFASSECVVCLEPYEDNNGPTGHSPSVLSCGHVFGHSCMVKYIEDRKLKSLTPECPTCKNVISIDYFRNSSKEVVDPNDIFNQSFRVLIVKQVSENTYIEPSALALMRLSRGFNQIACPDGIQTEGADRSPSGEGSQESVTSEYLSEPSAANLSEVQITSDVHDQSGLKEEQTSEPARVASGSVSTRSGNTVASQRCPLNDENSATTSGGSRQQSGSCISLSEFINLCARSEATEEQPELSGDNSATTSSVSRQSSGSYDLICEAFRRNFHALDEPIEEQLSGDNSNSATTSGGSRRQPFSSVSSIDFERICNISRKSTEEQPELRGDFSARASDGSPQQSVTFPNPNEPGNATLSEIKGPDFSSNFYSRLEERLASGEVEELNRNFFEAFKS